jgi:uncharacterized protein (TIGR02145 family)
MGLSIGNRSGVPIPLGSRHGVSRISSRHGIPFYNPAGIYVRRDCLIAEEATITFTSRGRIWGEVPSGQIRAVILFRFLLASTITGSDAVVPAVRRISAETNLWFYSLADSTGVRQMPASTMILFESYLINRRLAGFLDVQFNRQGALTGHYLWGTTSMSFTAFLRRNVLIGSINIQFTLDGLALPVWDCCAEFEPYLETEQPLGNMFLNVGKLLLTTGTIGDYAIEWRLSSRTGTIVFISGEGSDPDIQAQHPVVNEVIFAGTLYPVIRYIYVDGVKYSPYYEEAEKYATDLLTCLDPIVILAITCTTTLGADPVYQYYLTYNNLTDVAYDKSRLLKFEICNDEGMKYLALSFEAYQVADQLKIYYCTALDEAGVLLDNFIVNRTLAPLFNPVNYPVNPIQINTNYNGMSPFQWVVNFSSFTYAAGDYLRIEVIGSVLEPTNNNTNWWIKLQHITTSDVDCASFFADGGIGRITDTPVLTYNPEPNCRYEITYNTEDELVLPSKTAPATPFLYKYFPWGNTLTGGILTYTTNPVKLYLSWSVIAQYYGMYSSVGFSTCMNLTAGQTMTISKTTSELVFTFTDQVDYDKYVADIAAMRANACYTDWLTYPTNDIRYLAYWWCTMYIGNSCGDAGVTQQVFNFHLSCPIAYDAVNKTITVTFVIPENLITDSECNSTYELAVSTIATLNSTKNLSWPSTHTHIRPVGLLYVYRPTSVNTFTYQQTMYYGFFIYERLLNNICTVSQFGFCSEYYAYDSNWAILYRMYDRFTFTQYGSHTHRMNNWRLERRKALRTGVCTDTSWEIIHEVSNLNILVGSTTLAFSGISTVIDRGHGKGNETIQFTQTAVLTNVGVGRLFYFNYYALVDARNFAPAGWHVASLTEWQTLQTYLGGASVAGGKMKLTGFTWWGTPNTGATNESGWNGRGSGYRDMAYGGYNNYKNYIYYGSATAAAGDQFCIGGYFYYYSDDWYSIGTTMSRKYGFPARLIKDDSTDPITMTGNDGKIYPTVKIGTQVWQAIDSEETKYRNGDTIPEVLSDYQWTIQTAGARCEYGKHTLWVMPWNNANISFTHTGTRLLKHGNIKGEVVITFTQAAIP